MYLCTKKYIKICKQFTQKLFDLLLRVLRGGRRCNCSNASIDESRDLNDLTYLQNPPMAILSISSYNNTNEF